MLPGGAGAPPAGTRTRCEELADGAKPLALPDAQRRAAPQGGEAGGFFGKAISRQKRGPAVVRRRRGAPRGAGALATRRSHTENWSAFRRATPSIFARERKGKAACPGPQTMRAMMRGFSSPPTGPHERAARRQPTGTQATRRASPSKLSE